MKREYALNDDEFITMQMKYNFKGMDHLQNQVYCLWQQFGLLPKLGDDITRAKKRVDRLTRSLASRELRLNSYLDLVNGLTSDVEGKKD